MRRCTRGAYFVGGGTNWMPVIGLVALGGGLAYIALQGDEEPVSP
jgi:hypothetical protein